MYFTYMYANTNTIRNRLTLFLFPVVSMCHARILTEKYGTTVVLHCTHAPYTEGVVGKALKVYLSSAVIMLWSQFKFWLCSKATLHCFLVAYGSCLVCTQIANLTIAIHKSTLNR